MEIVVSLTATVTSTVVAILKKRLINSMIMRMEMKVRINSDEESEKEKEGKHQEKEETRICSKTKFNVKAN